MPKVQRKDIPRALFAQLAERIAERNIDPDTLKSLATELDGNSEVPTGDWFMRFPTMTVCGKGALVKTFPTSSQDPSGRSFEREKLLKSCQCRFSQRPHPESLGMLGVNIEIVAAAMVNLGAGEGHPTRRFVAGASQALGIDEGFQEEYRMTEALLAIRG